MLTIFVRRFAVLTSLLLCHVVLAADGKLSGRVLNDAGKPIPGASVHLYNKTVPETPDSFLSTVTDTDGRYHFEQLEDLSYKLYAHAKGWCTDGRMFGSGSLKHGSLSDLDMTLTRPTSLDVLVLDEQGKPVTGAQPHHLFWEGRNGSIWIPTWFAAELGLELNPSGEDGRTTITGLPEDAIAKVVVEHHDLVRKRLRDLNCSERRTHRVVLQSGVPVTLQFLSYKCEMPREVEVWFERDGGGFDDYIWERFRLDQDGTVTFRAIPGQYAIRPRHETLQMYPAELDAVELQAGTPLHLQFTPRPLGIVRGRVVNALTGAAISDYSVRGLIENPAMDSNPFGFDPGWTWGGTWLYDDLVKTDEQGRYEMQIAIGPVRIISPRTDFIADPPFIETDATINGAIAPDLKVFPVPAIRGQVVDANGIPVPGAIIKRQDLRSVDPPIECDEHGRFERVFNLIPEAKDPSENEVITLYAFDPDKPCGMTTIVTRESGKAQQDLRIVLQPEKWSPPAPTTSTPRPPELDLSHLNGQAAPELECLDWLQAGEKPLSISELRGKWVLLDFWTTWCEPCRIDKPELELIDRLYRDQGLVVIGIHDNSVPPEQVKQHVAENGPRFPIGIDEKIGTTINSYGVKAYPIYILINPQGRVVDANSSALRHNTLESVRYYLLKRKVESQATN